MNTFKHYEELKVGDTIACVGYKNIKITKIIPRYCEVICKGCRCNGTIFSDMKGLYYCKKTDIVRWRKVK